MFLKKNTFWFILKNRLSSKIKIKHYIYLQYNLVFLNYQFIVQENFKVVVTTICVFHSWWCAAPATAAGDKITNIITEDAVNSGMRVAADHSPNDLVSRQSRNLHRPGKIPDV